MRRVEQPYTSRGEQLTHALDQVADTSLPGGEATRRAVKRAIGSHEGKWNAQQDRAIVTLLEEGDTNDPLLVAVAFSIAVETGPPEALDRWGRELKRCLSALADPHVLALVHGAIARVSAERGDWPQAERQLMSALALTPTVVDYSLWLAEGLLEHSRIEDAKFVLVDALAINPNEERLQGLLARTLPDSTTRVSWRYSR